MATLTDRPDAEPGEGGSSRDDDRSSSRPRRSGPKPRWWRRPWVVPLMFVTLAFVAFSLPPYLTFDPDLARVPPPAGVPGYHPMLALHVIFGSVAILTCCFQVWPWFRARYPRAHRITGRVYVLAGVFPAAVIGLFIGALSPFGPVARVSNVLLAALWLWFTVQGFRMARRRRFADHRRWMVRSFALTVSIITNRVWGAVWTIVLWPRLETTYHGDEQLLVEASAGLTAWLSWTTCLLVAEWWLVERPRRRDRRPQPQPTAPQM